MAHYYYMPMPVNASGDGPANDNETVRVLHEVWDDTCLTVCACGDEAAARHVASLLNEQHPVVAPQQPAPQADALPAFLNAVRILHSMEPDGLSRDAYSRFISDPVGFMLRADDAVAARLWRLVNDRQPERYRV